MTTATLYRPVGPVELELIAESGWRSFPPRLPEQPFFYPVLNEEYAAQIAERWNVRESGAGYVTAFEIDGDYVARFEVQRSAAASTSSCGWPQRSWPNSTGTLFGTIRVVREFGGGDLAAPDR